MSNERRRPRAVRGREAPLTGRNRKRVVLHYNVIPLPLDSTVTCLTPTPAATTSTTTITLRPTGTTISLCTTGNRTSEPAPRPSRARDVKTPRVTAKSGTRAGARGWRGRRAAVDAPKRITAGRRLRRTAGRTGGRVGSGGVGPHYGLLFVVPSARRRRRPRHTSRRVCVIGECSDARAVRGGAAGRL